MENEKEIGRENGRMCIGDWGVGKSNENGRRLIEECALNGWSIASSFFNTPSRKKWTFYGSFHDGNGRFPRECDHIVCDHLRRKRMVKLNMSEILYMIPIIVQE